VKIAYLFLVITLVGCSSNPVVNQFGLKPTEAAYLHNGSFKNKEGSTSGVLFTKINGTTLDVTLGALPITNVFLVPPGKSVICAQINQARALSVDRNIAILEADLKPAEHYHLQIEDTSDQRVSVYLANDQGEAASKKIITTFSEKIMVFGVSQGISVLKSCS
jgi:hypothetical protein